MGTIRIGTCSWTDPTLIKAGTFYPSAAKTPEARLTYYSSQFNIVEVDSSYYALPSRRNATLWVERTPEDFIFDVKSFRLFTQHPTQPQSIPADIRGALPREVANKPRLYYRDLPTELQDHMWSRFVDALLPLDSAGKLGVVLFQYPPWFHPGIQQMDHILECKERVTSYKAAVEFRNNAWLAERNRDATLSFLRDHDLAFVCVDEPQGFKSSVPPVTAVTSDTAIVRFHGRKGETWEKKNVSAVERFDYYYDTNELAPWAASIKECAAQAGDVHVLFNTNNGDQGVANARLMATMF